MLGKVWQWGGRYRDTELNIGVPVHQIREEIKKLCDDAAYWDSFTNPYLCLSGGYASIIGWLKFIHSKMGMAAMPALSATSICILTVTRCPPGQIPISEKKVKQGVPI